MTLKQTMKYKRQIAVKSNPIVEIISGILIVVVLVFIGLIIHAALNPASPDLLDLEKQMEQIIEENNK